MKGARIEPIRAIASDKAQPNHEETSTVLAHNKKDSGQNKPRRKRPPSRWTLFRWFLRLQWRRTKAVWLAMTGQSRPQRNVVLQKTEIEKLSISLEVGNQQSLFILLAADGTVNRLGTGMADNTEHDMFIGVTRERVFEQVLENVPQDIFEHRGAYHIPGKQGKAAELNVIFSNAAETKVAGFMFQYHSRSKGPPPEISRIVIDAVNLTEQWYRQQKEFERILG